MKDEEFGPTAGALRTPDERFANLPGYNFEPNYVVIRDLRLHYVNEGPADTAPVLLSHGEPSWSYLYRKMIPILLRGGHRVISPDLVGFGRSDKLPRKKDYSHQMHVNIMTAFIRLEGRNTGSKVFIGGVVVFGYAIRTGHYEHER